MLEEGIFEDWVLKGFYFADGHFQSKNRIKFEIGPPTKPFLDNFVTKKLPLHIYNHNIFNSYHHHKYIFNIQNTLFQQWLIKTKLNIRNKTLHWEGDLGNISREEFLAFLLGFAIGECSISEKEHQVETVIKSSYTMDYFLSLFDKLEILYHPPSYSTKKQYYYFNFPARIFLDIFDNIKTFADEYDLNDYYKIQKLIKRLELYQSIKNNIKHPNTNYAGNNAKHRTIINPQERNQLRIATIYSLIQDDLFKYTITPILEHPIVTKNEDIRKLIWLWGIARRKIIHSNSTLSIQDVLTEAKLEDIERWAIAGMPINPKWKDKLKSIWGKDYSKTGQQMVKAAIYFGKYPTKGNPDMLKDLSFKDALVIMRGKPVGNTLDITKTPLFGGKHGKKRRALTEAIRTYFIQVLQSRFIFDHKFDRNKCTQILLEAKNNKLDITYPQNIQEELLEEIYQYRCLYAFVREIAFFPLETTFGNFSIVDILTTDSLFYRFVEKYIYQDTLELWSEKISDTTISIDNTTSFLEHLEKSLVGAAQLPNPAVIKSLADNFDLEHPIIDPYGNFLSFALVADEINEPNQLLFEGYRQAPPLAKLTNVPIEEFDQPKGTILTTKPFESNLPTYIFKQNSIQPLEKHSRV